MFLIEALGEGEENKSHSSECHHSKIIPIRLERNTQNGSQLQKEDESPRVTAPTNVQMEGAVPATWKSVCPRKARQTELNSFLGQTWRKRSKLIVKTKLSVVWSLGNLEKHSSQIFFYPLTKYYKSWNQRESFLVRLKLQRDKIVSQKGGSQGSLRCEPVMPSCFVPKPVLRRDPPASPTGQAARQTHGKKFLF